MKEKIFKYWSRSEDTDLWHSTFLERTQPTLERDWSWCPASLTHRYTSEKLCEDCGQPVKQVQKRLIRPHITQPIGPGIYLLDVGHYRNAPGPPRLKIGMSQSNVLGRLEAHLQNVSHERCVLHYCFPAELPDTLTWHIPQMLEHLLNANMTLNGAELAKDTEDYFTWSDKLLEQCIEYLNRPGLVDGIHHLIANP